MNIERKRQLQLVIGIFLFLLSMVGSFFSVVGSGEDVPNDVMIVIDISGSMNDISEYGSQYTKLQVAKQAGLEFCREIANSNKSIRLGLVAFQTNAYLLAPLSNDTSKVENELERLGSGGNTALGDAILVAKDHLMSSVKGNSKTIVLMSDGISNEGVGPLDATDQAARQDIVIYTIGYGTDADIATLKTIASKTEGRFFNALTGSELIAIYNQIASLLISPLIHYGSRTLTLISMPILLFLPEIERRVTTFVYTMRGSQPPIYSPQDIRIRHAPQVQYKTCSSCSYQNRMSASFCAKCGSNLHVSNLKKCQNCGQDNRTSARFCNRCGRTL